jgi:sugar lactone lactonase YvrE
MIYLCGLIALSAPDDLYTMNKLSLLAAVLAFAACNNPSENKTVNTYDTAVAPPAEEPGGEHPLELIFSDANYQLTGVAKEEGGGLLVSYPRWSGPYQSGVVIANGPTGKIPYPDEAMNSWKPGQPGSEKWVCVQSVYFDELGTPWVLDPAAPGLKTIQGGGAKLVRMSRETGKVDRSYPLGSVLADTSYANDVRVDVARAFAYITESKGGGIIVIDLESGRMRRVLAGHPSTKSDTSFRFVIDGRELSRNGTPVKIHSDGIALNPDGSYLYYKPLTDDKLYRISTEALRDFGLDEKAVAGKVEDLGHFTTTDGMIFDKRGNLYLGDLQRSRIMRISPDHRMTQVLQDDRLIWPDSYAIADGFLYISCSQIQKQPDFNGGVNKRTSPYTVYRMKL